jgi:predicted permease
MIPVEAMMRPGNWIYTIPLRLRSLFRRDRVEEELAEEMRGHLERLIEQHRARGANPAEARAAALRAMDGMEQRKEQCRDARQVRFIEDFLQDVRFALRTLARNPIFALTAVISLALGIGANSAIFTAADAVLWRPLPVDHPENLVRFVAARAKRNDLNSLPAPLAETLNRRGHVFDGAIAEAADGLSFSYDGRAERVVGASVTPNYFSVLGVKTILGQTFSSGVRAGQWAAEAVISYRFWKNRFGGDPGVVGRVIHLNTYPFTIVGVSEPSFYDLSRGLDPELRIPRMPAGQDLAQMQLVTGDGQFNWNIMARIKPGVTLAQAAVVADADFQDILRSSTDEAVQRFEIGRLRTLPGDKGWPSLLEEFSNPLWILFGLVGGVLLIACANVANMLLARAAARRRELAVRCSVGAGRARLVRQMLAESLLLAWMGGALGMAASYWCGPMLLHFLPRGNITLALDLHPGARALLFTSALALVTGALFGLFPAVYATRGDLAGALRADTAASIGDARSAVFRKILVAGQVAFSLAVLIAAGLFVRTLHNLRPRDLRVDPNRVLQFMIKPQQEIYSDARKYTMLAELIRRVSEVPGVEAAALAQPAPFVGNGGSGVLIEVPGGNSVRIANTNVTPGILHTLGIELLAGRDFTAADKPGAPLVALINQAAARALYGGENPVGRTFRRNEDHGSATYQVVGVVEDVHYAGLYQSHRPFGFFPFQRQAPYMPVLHVRVNNADTAGMFAALHRAFDDVDKGFPVFDVKTMSMQIDDALARERMVADLSAAFGGLALTLAAVGLYGVLAYSVTRRTREIGIRMALGSDAASAAWMIVRDALQLIGIGCAAGILLAAAAGRFVASYLFGVSALDLVTLLSAAGLMLTIAAAAVCAPALRASRIDPLTALRHE